jgi:hypothetical protein
MIPPLDKPFLASPQRKQGRLNPLLALRAGKASFVILLAT